MKIGISLFLQCLLQLKILYPDHMVSQGLSVRFPILMLVMLVRFSRTTDDERCPFAFALSFYTKTHRKPKNP